MRTNLGPSPGHAKYPQHSVAVSESSERWKAVLDEKVLAESDATFLVEETGYPPVVYFPPADVQHDAIRASDSLTTCPFKGQANYYAAEVGGKHKDIAWTYPSVYREVAPIAGYIAFYSNVVQVTSGAAHED